MPRTKARKTPAENQAQFSRSLKNNKGVWRGKNSPKPYKRKRRKPKTIWDKEPLKIEYQPKHKEMEFLKPLSQKQEDEEEFFAKQ